MKIFILGVNGFIGNTLAKRLIEIKNIKLFGVDINTFNIEKFKNKKNFFFYKLDVFKSKKKIESILKKSDVVIPLVAIATPNVYVKDPLKIFRLDFESNLEIIKLCAKYKKRIIFPSTSEVYGMCDDKFFDEKKSKFVLGPINKPRWIYSCSKQLLDRVILAYTEQKTIKSTIFRPFNWIGPKLDSLKQAQLGNGRVLSIFINNLLKNKNLYLVNGGNQSRSLTYIDDGIDALEKIIFSNPEKINGEIFNIGNPKNNISIKELAYKIVDIYNYKSEKKYKGKIIKKTEKEFYGSGYQDIQFRLPNILNAKNKLKWSPKYNLKNSLVKTIEYYLNKND